MTGLPTVTAHLDDGSGTWPHNVTSYVHLGSGVSGECGRGDEFAEVDAGEISVTLKARDGRFTFGSVTYGCYVDQPLRVVIAKGAASRTYIGAVQSWPLMWDSGLGNRVVVKLDAVDEQARLSRTELISIVANQILLSEPVAYWPLTEAEGSTSAGDISGKGRPSLIVAGSGTALGFAAATGPVDGASCVQFSGGQYLVEDAAAPRSGWGGEVAAFITTTTGGIIAAFDRGSTTLERLEVLVGGADTGKVRLTIDASLGFVTTTTSSVRVDDGAVHYVRVLDAGGSTYYLEVDGVTQGLVGLTTSWPDYTQLRVGHGFTGGISHVTLGPVDGAAIAEAGLTGFADEPVLDRLQRIASFGGTDVQVLGGGTARYATVPRQTLAGVTVWDALADVVTADGGLLFCRATSTASKPTVVWRNRMTQNAVSAPVVVSARWVDPADLTLTADKQFVKTVASGSQGDGGTVRYATSSPLGAYPVDFTGLLVDTDAEVLARCQWVVNTYAAPLPRMATLSVDLHTVPDAVAEALLALNLGDCVQLTDLPGQASSATVDLIVEGWDEAVTDKTWSIQLNTSPAELRRMWVLGDPVYGRLGITNRLGY